MPRSFFNQETQISPSELYNDTITPSEAAFETNPANIEDDLNNLRSQMHNLHKVQAGNWWDDLLTPSTFENGAQRGVDDLNQDLHDLQRKRVLRDVHSLVDVAVPATQNFVVLGVGEIPANTTAAVGAVTTLGTVIAFHSGTFGTHSLDEVSGPNPISPNNLMLIVDGATRDPILSSGRQVYGLLQSEIVTDGHTINTSTQQAQISFVRINAAGDDLEAVPFADIENQTINYCTRERVAIEDLNEADFLKGAIVDIPGTSTATRQNVYDNQGTAAVEVTTNSRLDLNAANIHWEIRDLADAILFRITEGSTGGTTTFNVAADVDTFDVDAAVNDFANGATLNSGGTRPITVGVTDGEITTTAGDLMVRAAAELLFDDVNQTGSTWAQDGIKLSETTAEWNDFETAFGEVSLLNAIVQANNNGGDTMTRASACVNQDIAANTNVTGAGGSPNIDAQLLDYSSLTFVDDVLVFLNGQLLRPGADASANHDVYPGTTPANGDLQFEFRLRFRGGTRPDCLSMITFS